MKRSEMLAAIRSKLLGTFIDRDNFELQILDTVEELGMLPPSIIEPLVPHYGMTENGEYVGAYRINRWEPE